MNKYEKEIIKEMKEVADSWQNYFGTKEERRMTASYRKLIRQLLKKTSDIVNGRVLDSDRTVDSIASFLIKEYENEKN
jgi:hypothetical protein